MCFLPALSLSRIFSSSFQACLGMVEQGPQTGSESRGVLWGAGFLMEQDGVGPGREDLSQMPR